MSNQIRNYNQSLNYHRLTGGLLPATNLPSIPIGGIKKLFLAHYKRSRHLVFHPFLATWPPANTSVYHLTIYKVTWVPNLQIKWHLGFNYNFSDAKLNVSTVGCWRKNTHDDFDDMTPWNTAIFVHSALTQKPNTFLVKNEKEYNLLSDTELSKNTP